MEDTVTHLHISVLQYNCHIAPTLCGHHGIYPDLKFVCVCKSKCIHVFMCERVWNHMWIAVKLCAVCLTSVCMHLCVCVIKLHGSTAWQLFCNGVQWESVLERLPHTACVHAWPSWHPRASLALQPAHSQMHPQSCLFLKSPANQHSFPCLNAGPN